MVELNEQALEAIGHKGHSIGSDDVLGHIECYHPSEEPGVTQEVLTAYGETIERDERVPFSAASLLKVIESRLTDSETWIEGAFYEVAPDRMSMFPIRWHENLTAEMDVREHVRFIQSDASGYRGTDGKLHAAGVPKSLLRATLAVLGGQHSYTAADQQIYEFKHRGELAVYPDQHPNADVQLRE